MNGIELCQKLRSIPHHKNTPVIFVTGETQNRPQNLLSLADDLISKPISALELIVKATIFLFSTSRPRAPKPGFIPSADDVPASKNGHGPAKTPAPSGNSDATFQPASQVGELASVYEKVRYLKEALSEETRRRDAVERQAAENAKRRAELEAAI